MVGYGTWWLIRLEHSLCNVEDIGLSPHRDGCYAGTVSKSFTHCSVLSTDKV